jgi:hypothetical protein
MYRVTICWWELASEHAGGAGPSTSAYVWLLELDRIYRNSRRTEYSCFVGNSITVRLYCTATNWLLAVVYSTVFI